MNTVSLGLQLLGKKLRVPAMGDAELADTLRVVEDIKLSCDNTLDILNELLICDKIENGVLNLDKSTHSPRQFLQEACQPFYIQVRLSICYSYLWMIAAYPATYP
jgi:signal transduction histidine kinase